MNQPVIEKRFFFHANAVALGAHIRRRQDFFVPAIASSCLPITGGEGSATAPGQSFGDMISFESASSRVFGDFTDRAKAAEFTHGNHGDNNLPTVTVVEAKITGLRITVGGKVIEADSIEAHMESFSDRRTAPRFHSLSASFQGVRIGGFALNVSTHTDLFNRFDTKEKLRRAFWDDDKFRAEHSVHFFRPDDSTSPGLPEAHGLVYGTIVNGLHWEKEPLDNIHPELNRLAIPGFGTLHFGEIVIQEGFRRVSLLRFQLGCPDGGEGTAVDVSSNGTGWPPQMGGT